VMTGPAMLARVVAFQRTFLLAVPLENRRIQVSAVQISELTGEWRSKGTGAVRG
jgi:hypothetical protein